MKKISLFFGAGAEYSYGLPSGGKFALDIFKMDTVIDKKELKEQIQNIDTQSIYAKWLPDDFKNRKLSAFTKGQYDTLVKGSLENKRHALLDYLKNFDENVGYIVKNIKNKGIDIDDVFEAVLGQTIGSFSYGQDIKLNNLLDKEYNGLFESEYFSAFLKAIELKDVDVNLKKGVRNITRSILELLIGSLGEELTHKLNDGIFEKSPDSMDLFDDLGAIFTLDYNNTGMKGLEILLESDNISVEVYNSDEDKIVNFGMLILEDIYSRALDYQSLIDSNWRYIYSPKTDWGKFSKINIFLHTVRRYISNIALNNKENIEKGNGYYHDINQLKDSYEVYAIGTTNYNTFIEDIINKPVFFLNGSVKDYYDPYLNKIVNKEDNEHKKHIIVPFLFTQSGIKPLTSVKMSSRYVDLYNKFNESDIICICGFGFNSDDGHINGMFRELIEDEDKKLVILHLQDSNNYDEKSVKNYYKNRLRLDSIKNLNIIPVNRERIDINTKEVWYKTLNEF